MDDDRVAAIRSQPSWTVCTSGRALGGWADGARSLVASHGRRSLYDERPVCKLRLLCVLGQRAHRGAGVYLRKPLVFVFRRMTSGFTYLARPRRIRCVPSDVEGHFLDTLESLPVAGRARAVAASRREIRRARVSAEFLSEAGGTGWALVGDAGHTRIRGGFESATRSVMPSCSVTHSTPDSRADDQWRFPGLTTNARATSRAAAYDFNYASRA